MLRDRGRSLQPVGFEADARPMLRRLALTMFSVLLFVPATASAAERADARAFADIALRAAPELAAVRQATARDSDVPPRCKVTHRLHARGTERDLRAVDRLYTAHWIARYARRLEPIGARTATDPQAVATDDAVLRSGRTAWRRLARAFARFGSLEPVRFCSEVRDYVRGDFHRTPAMQAANRALRRAMRWDTSDLDARLGNTVTRLVELGIPGADAEAFAGLSDS
jgi:hypothetical protein